MNKLTREQYDDLQAQYEKLPDLSTACGASGEHYVLISMLNKLGFYPGSRESAIQIAERLLTNGYHN